MKNTLSCPQFSAQNTLKIAFEESEKLQSVTLFKPAGNFNF